MTTRHTPGPWSVGQQEGVDVHVIHMHGACGAAIYSMGCEASETEATARLIAAAPDLLEALERIRDLYPSEMESSRIARAAITKAKGEKE